jgi:hypothetical protein
VVREVQEYLRCGRLEYGLLHCQCQCCGHDEVCAFSCKRRGFCPLCFVAADVVDLTGETRTLVDKRGQRGIGA